MQLCGRIFKKMPPTPFCPHPAPKSLYKGEPLYDIWFVDCTYYQTPHLFFCWMASLLTTWKFQGCNRLFAEFVAAKPEGRKTALGDFSIVLNLNHSKIGLKDWFIGTIPLTIVLAPMHSVGLEMVRDAFKAPRLGRKKTYIAGQSLLDDSTPVL